MKQNLAKWLIALLIVVVISGGVALGAGVLDWNPSAFGAASVPLLANPGFEAGFYLSGGVGELEVGNDWNVWFDPDPAMHRPEYKPETRTIGRGRVHSGDFAQKLFTTYSPHSAGVYQEIYGVEPGEWYRFSFWAYQWSSNEDNPDVSAKDGKCSVLAGINPWGDTNALYRTTVWGKEALQIYDQWVQVEVVAQAWSEKIVVMGRQDCEWPVKHNDAELDDARLSLATVDSVPTSTPYPTYTPLPTYTPGPTQPCPTGEPGAGIDYAEIERRVREVVGTVVAEREPVRWPR